MSSVNHHADDLTLADFATGRLDEARSIVIASHLALCPRCSQRLATFEGIGGAILSETAPVEMAPDALESIFARADASLNVHKRTDIGTSSSAPSGLPYDRYLDNNLDDVEWRTIAPGLAQHIIEADGYRPGVLRLLKISPGTKVPRHSHKGGELTLILRGAYEDELGRFGVGDLADLDPDHTHTPMAIGDEPCICLIATAAPLEFKTLSGKIAQPFIGL